MPRPGPGEGLTPHEPLGQPELEPDLAYLVLEQRAQRLDQLELDVLGKAADVVVRLDRRGAVAAARLDHVRIERALDEVARVAELRGLLLEDADELIADDLALRLRLGGAREAVEEALLGVDRDQRHVERVAEGRHHLVTLVLAHQPVVDEDARELVADGLVHEQRGDRRVDAARESADDAPVAHLRANPLDLLLDHGRRGPGALAAADVAEEALEDLRAVRGVDDLRVELDSVEAAVGVLERGDRRLGRRRKRRRARRRLVHRVAVGHPAGLLGGKLGEQPPGLVHRQPRAAELAHGRARPRGRRARAPSPACRSRCPARECRARAAPAAASARRPRRPTPGRRTGSARAAGAA